MFRVLIQFLIAAGVIISAYYVTETVAKSQPEDDRLEPLVISPVADAGLIVPGIVEPRSGVITLYPETYGRINEVFVLPGQSVSPGDGLFAIDTAQYDIILRQAEAKIRLISARKAVVEAEIEAMEVEGHAARSSLNLAEEKAQLYADLEGTGTSKSEYLDLREGTVQRKMTWQSYKGKISVLQSELNVLSAELEVALAEEEKGRLELERTIVRSPIYGQVLSVNVRPGDIYEGLRAENPPSVSVGDLSVLRVRTHVNELQLSRYQKSLSATIERRGDTEPIYLRHVHTQPVLVAGDLNPLPGRQPVETRQLEVLYEIAGQPPAHLFSGMSVDVRIPPAKEALPPAHLVMEGMSRSAFTMDRMHYNSERN